MAHNKHYPNVGFNLDNEKGFHFLFSSTVFPEPITYLAHGRQEKACLKNEFILSFQRFSNFRCHKHLTMMFQKLSCLPTPLHKMWGRESGVKTTFAIKLQETVLKMCFFFLLYIFTNHLHHFHQHVVERTKPMTDKVNQKHYNWKNKTIFVEGKLQHIGLKIAFHLDNV